ncbi:hypothetical protein DFY22_05670 [Escherichia coli]|uniref:Uncharacterized protein n=1 Tax=Citrobacter portucalensis TaxID=1639133 RepID=A0AAW5VUF1_9ENTR|nr:MULTISPECIES: hypothetical protein [Enterobacteriaceae]UAS93141.1 hypothetical protein K9O84_14150 [Enterobacter cloacae complex sp.]HEC5281212.1 hypothetical protein [Enterobacter cloacae]EEY4020050.1 hypothetical protein [Escherichia coli]EFB1434359.1 hypothetical protein [Escherichia coli]EFP2240367.1 hypothetical protein [Escherichia coli]
MSIYLDVEKMVERIDQRDLSRSTLQGQRSRFKAAGRTAEAEAIGKALEMTRSSASGVLRQSQRLAGKITEMDAEKAIELKATVSLFASKSTDMQASIVLAFQSLFEAKGVPMEYDEVMAFIMLQAADQFERITGELPVIVH